MEDRKLWKPIVRLSHIHFTPWVTMNHGQCIFLSPNQDALSCPPGSLGLLYFSFCYLWLLSSPGIAKPAVETGTWACRFLNNLLLGRSFVKGKIALVKELMGRRIYWNHPDKHRELWSGHIRHTNFPFSIISHKAHSSHFYPPPFFLPWENIRNASFPSFSSTL